MIKVIVPTYHRLPQLKRCLEGLAAEIEESEKDYLSINFVDNGSGPEVMDELNAFRSKYPDNVGVVLSLANNIGKAKACNKLARYLDIQSEDIVVSMDGDLIIRQPSGRFFETGEDILLFGAYTGCSLCPKKEEHKAPAVVVAYQTGNSRHMFKEDWHVPDNDPDLGVHTRSDTGFGVAGGCFFVMGGLWNKVGGYRSSVGLYGGDDGFFLLDAAVASKKPVWVLKNLVVEHPPEEDAEYAQWKQTVFEQQLKHGRCLMHKGFYDK